MISPNNYPEYYSDKMVSSFGGFSADKVKYGNEFYIVIHSGVDYGN